MKRRLVSIKGKIFIVYTLFAIVLLAVLWFFQIVYLNDFYKLIKKSETEEVLNRIEYLLNNESVSDANDEIEELAARRNLAIYLTDTEGDVLYNAEYISNSKMSSLPDKMFDDFYTRAVVGGGEATIEYKGSEMKKYAPDPDEDLADESSDEEDSEDDDGRIPYTTPMHRPEPFRQNFGNEMAESVIYVRIIYVNDIECVLMVNSVLTPVDATVSTLKSQLIIISIIMLVVAIIIATYFSRNISRSIIELNKGAKKLAAGEYDVSFNSRQYEEVSQLSDTLNFAAKELGKTDQLQKELIANVSHDLRTPLTMIKGYAEVMRDIPGENSPENIQVVVEETERLTGLVNDMLDISRLKAGTITIEPAEYNITESIRHVLERYNKLREVDGYTIDFEYDQEVEIYADEQKMFQVLYNLVNNAINYTGEDKKVTVVQKVIDNLLRIEVIDTGKGVSQEDIPYVWDRYYKDSSNHRRAIQGTGLGLSIVKSVLELHGAKYGVASKKGEGATFWFEIEISPFENDEE